MKILVTGGAGSVGREVVACLASRGHRVRVFDLPTCDFGPLEHRAQVEVVKGDIRDGDALRRAAADVDAANPPGGPLAPGQRAESPGHNGR